MFVLLFTVRWQSLVKRLSQLELYSNNDKHDADVDADVDADKFARRTSCKLQQSYQFQAMSCDDDFDVDFLMVCFRSPAVEM